MIGSRDVIFRNGQEAFYILKDYPAAIQLFSEALRMDLSMNANTPNQSIVLDLYFSGLSLLKMKRFTESLEFFQQALEAVGFLTENEQTIVLSICINIELGNAFYELQEPSLSLEYLHNARLIYEKSPARIELQLLSNVFHNLSNVYKDLQNLQQAEFFALQALEIDNKCFGETSLEVAQDYRVLGLIYRRGKEFSQSIAFHKEAIRINRLLSHGRNSMYVADDIHNLGLSYHASGDTDNAISAFLEAIKIACEITSSKKDVEIAKYHNSLGNTLASCKWYQKALTIYQEAMIWLVPGFDSSFLEDNPDPDAHFYARKVLLQLLANKTMCLSKMPGPDSEEILYLARKTGMRATDLLRTIFSETVSVDDKMDLLSTFKLLSNVQLTTLHSLWVLSAGEQIMDEAFAITELFHSSTLLSILHKNRMIDSLPIRPDLKNMLRELQKQKAALEIDYQRAMSSAAIDVDTIDHLMSTGFNLNREIEKTTNTIAASNPGFINLQYLQPPYSTGKIEQNLEKGEALIEYHVGDEFIFAFLIRSTGSLFFAIPVDKNLRKIVLEFHYALSIPPYLDPDFPFLSLGAYLHRVLVPPELRENLQGITNLAIIPDSYLFLIPFEALIPEDPSRLTDSAGLRYLVNEFAVSYHLSASLWLEKRLKKGNSYSRKERNGFLGIAPVFGDDVPGFTLADELVFDDPLVYENGTEYSPDGIFQSSFSGIKQYSEVEKKINGRNSLSTSNHSGAIRSLPGTKKEVRLIADRFRSRNLRANVKTDGYATKKEFLSCCSDYAFIHVATHGLIHPLQPQLSGILLFPDEKPEAVTVNSQLGLESCLLLPETFTLDLKDAFVCMSACVTGLGVISEGEGMITMVRGLLFSGCNGVIATLWEVDDEGSKELMDNFYKFLLDDKTQDYPAALAKAKQEMISNELYSLPYYWASYILIN